jgi:hypothetical protein
MTKHPLNGQVVITTPEAYSEAALSTACPDSAIDIEDRLHRGVLKKSLEDFLRASQVLDHVKKTAVYGKPFPVTMVAGAFPAPKPFPVDPQVFHAIVGIATEAGELVQALLKAMYDGKPMDDINLLEESGDVDWYQALLDSRINGDQVKRWQSNRDKLARRYAKTMGDKPVFTAEAAITRDLTAERAILDQAGAVASAAPEIVLARQGGFNDVLGNTLDSAHVAAPADETPVTTAASTEEPDSLDAGDKADPVIVVHDDTPVVEAPKAVEVEKPAPKHGKGHGRK